MNLVQEMVQFLDVATKSSTELSMLFSVQSKYYNDTKGNGSFVEPITRFSTVVAPKLYTYSNSLSMVYYGNDNGDFAFAERSSTGPYLYLSQNIFQDQFSELFKNKTFPASNNIYVFLTNDYFEPYLQKSNTVFRILYNSTYDPRVRPWYTATESLEKGKPVWSNVFVDVNGNLSIAASLVLNNLNSIKPSFKEVIGVHVIFKKIQTYLLGLYSYTNNLMILMENNGNLLTSNEDSFPLTYSNLSRVNISSFTSATKFSKEEKSFWGLSNEKLDLIEKISNVMVSNNLLDKRFNGTVPCTSETFQATQVADIPDQFCILNRFVAIKQYNTSTSFVSVSRLIDACGMDFYFIVSRTYYSFADVLVDHYVGLLVVLVVTVLIGTLAVLALTSCISYSLFFVSRKLYYISKLRQGDKPKQSLAYKAQRAINMIFYEVHTLQKCLDSVERANSSFIKYIPRSVVKFIVEGSSSAKLGMINAEITIVFTDLANFTNISESLSIHNLLLVISRYFEVVTSNVQECGGIIDKYIGDGCMALFNTPYQPVTHHAEHACKAAIKIVKGLKKLNKEMEEIYKMKLPTEISARVGVNTGSALIGNIGTHDRLNFTAVGDCVNVSSRLESLNRMYGTKILIGEGSVSTFKGIDKLRGETKDHFSTMLDQREFSLSDLSQKMMNLVEFQVATPKTHESVAAQASADLGKEMSFSSSSNNLKATSTSSSQDTSLPQVVTYFIDTICLKGKNQPVPVFAVQCDRKLATSEQIYIEKMLDLVRRELLEEKRLKDVIHLLRSLMLFFEENQLTDSPVFREHNTDHYEFKFGEEIHTPISSINGEKTEEEISTNVEGDPYPVIYKAISKLKERLELTLMEHEAKKRKVQINKKRSLLTALSIDTRSKSDPLIHPILPIIPDFSTTSLLEENNNIETVENSESTPTMAKYEYYRQMALMENENRRSSMKLDDFALVLHEK
ncbi:predicted protein [Naegleria gruberi]|uniref:Predicted protein n=1 Tax=Naegleria gruberi TaxID=5762 RepID=D2W246_NAEGR|nr:uncharacterized protein NAEGRDRAFT_82099 [Naegleria gruberi]EFC36880.1 predicted protein [Naegleria gruberi]|eukprot:XP_002669624.1 predicted protein [Naegleria gruberi strain NEG-M]